MARNVSVYGLVAYDGTAFHGFQYQVGVPTIQGVLESSLRAFADIDGRVAGSGRTDAGVHAAGQVIAARVAWQHSVAELRRAWNAHLPPSIYIHAMAFAPEGFHPRFSATGRTYRYSVYQADGTVGREKPYRSPLTDRYALFVPASLDVKAMQSAAQHLVGEHDFATFGQPPQGENTIRRVTVAEWHMVHTDLSTLQQFPGDRLVFTISANAFLRRMVRNIVGSLLEVGKGSWPSSDVMQRLALADRHYSAPPVPASGLVLERVDYPAELEICP